MSKQRLQLNLIDGFHASVAQQKLLLPSAASVQLLAYLALCHDMKESRSQLATLLWENSDELRARRNLRQMLYSLRAKIGKYWDGLQSNRDSLFMDSSRIKTDHSEIFILLRSGSVPESLLGVVQIQEKLLARINFPGELLSNWVQLMRREFENNLRIALEAILNKDDLVEKERAARAILGLDAADETAARILIEIYWKHGDLGKALGIYSHLWNHIDDVYGMEPTRKTQELIAKVKTSDYLEPALSLTPLITTKKFEIEISPVTLSNSPADDGAIGYQPMTQIYLPSFNLNDAEKTDVTYQSTTPSDALDRRTHMCRAWASSLLEEYSQVATVFSLALECDTNDPQTMFSMAIGTAFDTEPDITTESALQLDGEGWTTPIPQWGYHSNICFLAGDYAGCIAAAETAKNSVMNIQAWKAAAHWYLGEKEQAISAWGQFETNVKTGWTAEEDATTKSILSWFLACFPMEPTLSFERVKQGATNAADAYRQWSQT